MDPVPASPERLLADTLWLQRVARELVADPDAAEDLVQDTWLAALRHRGRAVLDRRAWLGSILRRRSISARRGGTARRGREADSARPEALPSTRELRERAELQRVLADALLALEEPFRTTALLRFLEGLEPIEIAERLGVPANTVRWRLRKAAHTLRERLDRDVGGHWGLALFALVDPAREGVAADAIPPPPVIGAMGAAAMLKNTLVAASALVAVAFLVLRWSAAPPTSSAVSPGEPAVSDLRPVGAEERASAPEGTVAREPVVAREQGNAAETFAAAATATLVFVATARENGRPLAGVAVSPEVRGRLLPDYGEPTERLSDAAGELEVEVPAREVVHVQAWGEEPPAGLAVLDVGPLAPGEVRRVPLVLPTAVGVRYFGRLVDEETGAPLAGVEVAAKYPSGLAAAVESARSDADGVVELRVPSWRLASFTATATRAGHGRIVFMPATGHDSRELAEELRLPRAATVEGAVGPDHLRRGATRVVLEVNRLDVLRPRVDASTRVAREEWTADVDDAGRYRVEGLNADARYRARLLATDGEVLREHAEELVLAAGETRVLDWRHGRGATLAGELVDQRGEPVAGVELWLVPTRWNDDRRFHAGDEREALRARTDAAGAFSFDDVAAGIWLVGPGLAEGDDVAPWATAVEIDEATGARDLSLATWRGLAVRGVVLDPAGAPAARASVMLDPAGGGARVRVRTDEEGRFEANGLRAIDYEVSAGGMDEGYARSEIVLAAPGEDVVLRMAESGSIRGRVAGERRLEDMGTALVSARTPPTPEDDWMSVGVRVDGYFALGGLAPGVYDVFVRRRDGRCALILGHRVEVGPAEELQVELVEGARLALSVTDGASWASYDLFVDGAFVAFGSCRTGSPVEDLVPPGRVEVRYRTASGAEETRIVDVESGGTAEVVLGD
jgi:RNA polymerase sigma-70 factor (ECF subfamily)